MEGINTDQENARCICDGRDSLFNSLRRRENVMEKTALTEEEKKQWEMEGARMVQSLRGGVIYLLEKQL